ncbi:MAG: YciI family protein, partial [Myxococcales bacterium]
VTQFGSLHWSDAQTRPRGATSGEVRREKVCRAMSIFGRLDRRLDEKAKGPARTRRQTMRVMVFVKASEETEKGVPPTTEAFEAMDRFTEELVKAGVMVAAAGLKPSAQAKRIAFEGSGRTVIDGPFAETKELIAGFSIWEVKDMDEAVAWAKRCPNPMSGRSEIEIRPFLEAADLAGFLTPEELSTPRDGTRGKLGVA